MNLTKKLKNDLIEFYQENGIYFEDENGKFNKLYFEQLISDRFFYDIEKEQYIDSESQTENK